MIDLIKSVALDISDLSNSKEIENYIPTQLIKHYPEPENLKYHYTLTGNREKRSALVSYIPKNRVEGSEKVKYPTLLFESVLKKCGHYIFIFSRSLLEVTLKDRHILSTKTSTLSDLEDIITQDSILVYDRENSGVIEGRTNKKMELEKLYSRCNSALFIKKKPSPLIPTLIGLIVIGSVLTAILLVKEYNRVTAKYEMVVDRYNRSTSRSNQDSEAKAQWDKLLNEHYLLKSALEPDLYTILFELNSGTPKRIMNLNYSNYTLSLNTLTTNGIVVTRELNSSPILDLKQNSAVSQENNEVVSITGEVLCP